MKPLARCARYLDPVLSRLHAATPLLIPNGLTVDEWVRRIPFLDLMVCDWAVAECDSWHRPLPGGRLGWYMAAQKSEEDEQSRQTEATQLALRMMFVIDIARRAPRRYRDALLLTGDVQLDLQTLMVEQWHRDALWWAAKYGDLHLQLPASPGDPSSLFPAS